MGSTARVPGTVSWEPWTIKDIKTDIKQTDKAFPRNVAYIENLRLDTQLQPAKYELAGTHPESKILITDVKILDSTGREPYRGDVLIQGLLSLPQKANSIKSLTCNQGRRLLPLERCRTKRSCRKVPQ